MTKPRRHTRANGGHALRGRRKAVKRAIWEDQAKYIRQRGKGRDKSSHIEPETTLKYTSESPDFNA